MIFLRVALLATTCLLSVPVLAQDMAPGHDEAAVPPSGDDFHGNVIYVTAGGLARLDMLAGTSVIEGDELQRNMAGQIGSFISSVAFGYFVTLFGTYDRALMPLAAMLLLSGIVFATIDPAEPLLRQQEESREASA